MRNLLDFPIFEAKARLQAEKYCEKNFVCPPDLQAAYLAAEKVNTRTTNVLFALRAKIKCPGNEGGKCICGSFPEIRAAAIKNEEATKKLNNLWDKKKKLEQEIYFDFYNRAIASYRAKEKFQKNSEKTLDIRADNR